MSHGTAHAIQPARTLQPEQPAGKAALWAGRVLTTLPALFLLQDAVWKLIKPGFVLEATAGLGFSESTLIPLGVVLASCTILYLIPKTAVIGAILLTGYLGGAVAAHVRVGDPPFNTVFPAIFGTLLWTGLLLRDARLRVLLPWRR